MQHVLKMATLETPLGKMVAIGDDKALHLLEFVDQKKAQATTKLGRTKSIDSIEKELKEYFCKRLTAFKTSLHLAGTPFQLSVWKALQKIPYGKTCSYAAIAEAIGKPTAFRAVANANGQNRFAIIIPCHRVINANGALGGYAGGVSRKKKLLANEQLL